MRATALLLIAVMAVTISFRLTDSSFAEENVRSLEEAPAAIQAFVKCTEEFRARDLRSIERRIETNKTIREAQSKWPIKRDGSVTTFPSMDVKERSLRELDEKIHHDEKTANAIRSARPYLSLPAFDGQFDVGSCGEFRHWENRWYCVVAQVIDDENMLIQYRNIETQDGPTVWVRGVATKGYADGKGIEFKHVFCVTETKKYKTVLGGSRTVYVLEPVDIEIAKAFVPKQPNKPDIAEPKPTPSDEISTSPPLPEHLAGTKLKLAKSLLKTNPIAAKKRLEEIVTSFPDTAAAADAKKLLKDLE